VTTLAVPALTETELKAALEALEGLKASGLKTLRFDPELPTGTVISFQKKDSDSEWILK
jgi:hypothetical protein